MTTLIFTIIFVAYVFAILAFCAWAQRRVKPWVYSLGWAVWCTVWGLMQLFVYHDQLGVALNTLIGSYWWHDFWRKKPPFDRKKVAKLIGAKAKALKQKLVDSMPAAKPVALPVGV